MLNSKDTIDHFLTLSVVCRSIIFNIGRTLSSFLRKFKHLAIILVFKPFMCRIQNVPDVRSSLFCIDMKIRLAKCTTPDQDTEWDSDKSTRKHHIPESQEVRLSQQMATRLQQGRHHSMTKTRRVPLREAQFSPKFLNMNRVESAMGWSTVLDCGMS